MATIGMLGQGASDQDVTDALLVSAARKRILKELEGAHGDDRSNSIVNNLYGSSGGGAQGMSGVSDLMNKPSGEDPFDYMVDIERRSLPDDPKGWLKKVHRYKAKKETT